MRGVSSDAPWRGSGDIIRNRVSGNGKGDRPRPSSVTEAERAKNYCRIFGCRRLTKRSIECRCCGRMLGPLDY